MSRLRTAWSDAGYPEILAQASMRSTQARRKLQALLDAERHGAFQ